MSNISSQRKAAAAISRKRKQVVAHCGSEDYLHIGIPDLNVKVGCDWLLHT
jgi:hypothetical protein